MFDELFGLPAHPLIIHAAVVFIPLLVAGSVVYGVVPRVRSSIAWAVVLLALAAPVAAFAAKESGEALFDARFSGVSGTAAQRITEHSSYANTVLLSTVGLAVSALALVYSSYKLGKAATAVLSVITVLLALAAGYYVVMIGHTGATAVWGG